MVDMWFIYYAETSLAVNYSASSTRAYVKWGLGEDFPKKKVVTTIRDPEFGRCNRQIPGRDRDISSEIEIHVQKYH